MRIMTGHNGQRVTIAPTPQALAARVRTNWVADVIRQDFGAALRLRAWEVPMRGTRLVLRRKGLRRNNWLWTSGHAKFSRHVITLTVGSCLADARAALLHELAHVATYRHPGQHRVHGSLFASLFRDSVEEWTGERLTAPYVYSASRGAEAEAREILGAKFTAVAS